MDDYTRMTIIYTIFDYKYYQNAIFYLNHMLRITLLFTFIMYAQIT